MPTLPIYPVVISTRNIGNALPAEGFERYQDISSIPILKSFGYPSLQPYYIAYTQNGRNSLSAMIQ